MKADFWHDRWQRNQIGFHNSEVHPLLIRFWPKQELSKDARVLVPLAGKSLDVRWLLEQGHAVTAVELNELAVETFFAEQQWPATKINRPQHTVFQHEALEFWAGDLFAIKNENVAAFEGVYDRAALIALPPEMRAGYVETMSALLKPGAKYLLISLEYPDDTLSGPPFAIDGQEIQSLFDESFSIHFHSRHPSEVKGHPCFETVYTLQRLDV
ncbi:MAG: thiopurine S-methyltransferase [Nitrospirales bacterium]|nr:MAG: thiopurine S-methyltransferase [Nitrospirales bacterium]